MQRSLKAEKLSNDSFIPDINSAKENDESLLMGNHDFMLDLINGNVNDNSNTARTMPNTSPNSNLSEFGQFSLYSSKTVNDNFLPYSTTAKSQEQFSIPDSTVQIMGNHEDFNGNQIIFSSNQIIPGNGYISYAHNDNFNQNQFVQFQPTAESNNSSLVTSSCAKLDYNSTNSNNVKGDDQVRKLEKKRERNREAARKCRERKMHHIELLENQLRSQRNSVKLMRNKMKLVINEMKRLGEYISVNIPQYNLRNVNEFLDENEIDKILNSDDND